LEYNLYSLKMDLPSGCRLQVVLLNGIDEDLYPLKDINLTNFAKIFGNISLGFLYLSNENENEKDEDVKYLRESVKDIPFNAHNVKGSNSFCEALTNLNYSEKLFPYLEGHIVMFLSVKVLLELSNKLNEFKDTVVAALDDHIKCHETDTPLITGFFRPSISTNSSNFMIIDGESGEILQLSKMSGTGSIDISEIVRSKSKSFKVSQHTAFGSVLILNDNKSISEILSDGTSSMTGFIKNLIDTGIVRPFHVLCAEMSYMGTLSVDETPEDRDVQIVDPFIKQVDLLLDDDAYNGEEAFGSEVFEFMKEGMRSSEGLNFKMMELKTYRLSMNKEDRDVFHYIFKGILDLIDIPDSTIRPFESELSTPLQPGKFENWFTDKGLDKMWDMYYPTDEIAFVDIYNQVYHFALRHINAGSTVPNIMGRTLKLIYNATEEHCDNELGLDGISKFREELLSSDNPESSINAVLKHPEFLLFLEWVDRGDESYSEDNDE